MHLRIQIKVYENVLTIKEAILLGCRHNVIDKLSAPAKQNDAELVAHIVEQNFLDGSGVLLVPLLNYRVSKHSRI